MNEEGEFDFDYDNALILITFRFIEKLTGNKRCLLNRENFGYYDIYYDLIQQIPEVKRYDAGLNEPSELKLKPFFESIQHL